MKISTGHAVTGDAFYGRIRELQRMEEMLGSGRGSLFIPGPRRIGKSSLVKECIRRNRDHYRFIYFDLEGRRGIADLCRDLKKEIAREFPNQIKNKKSLAEQWNTFSRIISEIEVKGFRFKPGQIPVEIKDLTDAMEAVLADLHAENLILAFDEFSDFILKLAGEEGHVQFFLEWLRRLRQEEKARFIITGSINIISTVESLNFTRLINDLIDVQINPLSPSEVEELLSNLLESRNITLGDSAMAFALGKLADGIPFYVQLFADCLTCKIPSGAIVSDSDHLQGIYCEITDRQQKEFSDLHNRLKVHLNLTDFKTTAKVLANLSTGPMSFDDLFPYIAEILPDREGIHRTLKRLMDECYIIRRDGQYSFVSPLLADWWRNNYDWER